MPRHPSLSSSLAPIKGSLGTAILQGLLRSQKAAFPFAAGSVFTNDDDVPPLEIAHIYTTVSQKEGVARVQAALEPFASPFEKQITSVTVHLAEATASIVSKVDIVILAVPHQIAINVLGHAPLRAALLDEDRQRTVISLAGGVSSTELYNTIYGEHDEACPNHAPTKSSPCSIIVAIPNVAAKLCKSMTIIASPNNLFEARGARSGLRDAIRVFKLVGEVKCVSEMQMPRAATIASASLAFWGKAVEAVACGASHGDDEHGMLDQDDAISIAAHAMRGAAELLLKADTSPQALIEEVASKGGSTEKGLKVLEDRDVALAFEEAVKASAGVREHEEQAK